MSLEKLKLSKPLKAAMVDLGYLSPKEVQSKTISRILGGQDLIMVGPLGAGKTTAYILAILMKLRSAFEEAPRALVLVPDSEHMEAVINQFKLLNRNKTMRIIGIDRNEGIAVQMNLVTDGVDIIVAVPDRARALYLKLALNTNKIQLFVVDDAQLMIKQGFQLPITELANSAYKSQHLVITEVMHEKIEKMIAPFMKMPTTISVDEVSDSIMDTHPMSLYKLKDFRSKLSFINYLLSDTETFTKVVIFVETKLTAQKVYKTLFRKDSDAVGIYNPLLIEDFGFSNVDEFMDNEECSVLIVANERLTDFGLPNVPFVIYLEVPETVGIFTARLIKTETEEMNFITFSTDIELATVTRIEQAVGQKMEVLELPEDFKQWDSGTKNKTKSGSPKMEEEEDNAAFHEKKLKNTKSHNFSAGQKAKMTYKNKKG